ncbi:MAG: GntR family transcriptional regulator [Acetanaerobacterium sp.]
MLITIDFTSRKPIYEQLKESVVRLAMLGAIEPNEQLPSVRTLAKQLAINPNTVQKAYQELEREAIVYSSPGRGSFLSAGVAQSARLRGEAKERLYSACIACKLVNINRGEVADIIDRVYKEEKTL